MASVPMLADQIGSPAPSSDLTEDLLRLQKASHRISSILDLDQLIDRIINEIARSFGLVEANIYLHEPDRDELVLACVHGCTKENLRLVANVTPEFLHQDFDLGERHVGPTSYLYEHVCCVCQHSSTIHQRIFQRLRKHVMRAIIGIGFAVAE